MQVPLSDKPTYDLCAEYLCIESLENPSKFYGFRSIIAQKFAGSAEPVEPVLKRPLSTHQELQIKPQNNYPRPSLDMVVVAMFDMDKMHTTNIYSITT